MKNIITAEENTFDSVEQEASLAQDAEQTFGSSGEETSKPEQTEPVTEVSSQGTLLWSSIFVTLMANKIGGLQFGIYRNCQISSRVFHTAVAALPLTKANRSDFE